MVGGCDRSRVLRDRPGRRRIRGPHGLLILGDRHRGRLIGGGDDATGGAHGLDGLVRGGLLDESGGDQRLDGAGGGSGADRF